MSVSNNDELKNKFLISEIEETDTLSQFMEKCNNNFSTIFRMGGGPDGVRGNKGDQGNPTKPKVPIHVWKKGVEYDYEKSNTIGFEINECIEDLSDVKYQDGHLILLENAHLYQLELDNNFNLKPKFIIKLLSFDPSNISDGKNSYIHIAYANDIVNYDGFITDQQLRNENYEDETETEQVSTFDLNRTVANNVNVSNMPYMGIYSDDKEKSSNIPYRYTWISIQGRVGEIGPRGPKGDTGPKGDKGDKGDSYTGHPFTVDLEGDMSTISIDIDRTRLYDDSDDYCECIAHAYYGKDSVKLNPENISILLSDEYVYDDSNNTIYSTSSYRPVGEIEISEIPDSNNVSIRFKPDESFVFPKKTMIFPIHIEREIVDGGKTYNFERDTVWSIRGIMSTFELEIVPQYKSIKLDTDGKYYPEKLFVDVYKVEDAVRTLFDIKNSDSDNDGIVDFTLLYKDYDSNEWLLYPDDGVDTKDVSCLEFKVVRYYNSESEEVWDYEDVWVVADGKSAHYYHADLGNTESMMILTTGDKINIGTKNEPKYCAELRNSKGYTITFEPKFYDGSEPLNVTGVSIGTNSGEIYYSEGTFGRELTEETIDGVVKKCNLTITKVPYGVDVIPMNIVVNASYDNGDSDSDTISNIKSDTVSFNLYITTLTDTYTLVPSVSSFNTSAGKTGDTISCAVYKNNTLIEFSQIPTELEKIGLKLKYAVHNEKTTTANIITYTEPIIFGDDDDIDEDEFTSSDVAIVFILYYNDKEIVRSTVPLIKDGIDGADGDCWQYIFCRSPRYPFDKTGISNPNEWTKDPYPEDSNSEYLGDKESKYPDDKNLQWYDDHLEINSEYKYEYQAYRKWDKTKKCWGKYGNPTLYSNYSESGSGYSVLLSNPIAVIPVSYNDWSVDENATNQKDSTFVYFYNTTKDISKDTNVSISIPVSDHFSAKRGDDDIWEVTFTPVVGEHIFNFGSNTQYKLPITLTYDLGKDEDGDSTNDKFTTTINWTLSPIKGLEDVEVFVDKRVVNTSIADVHPLKVGYYLNFSNGVKITVDIANTDNDPDKKNTKEYQIHLTNDISNLSDKTLVTDWQNASYKFIDDDGNKRNCYVVLVDSDGKTIIDYIDVVPVSDGNEGKPGSGKIPYYAGVYNNDTRYSQTDTSTPYVFYNDENNGSESGYYLLIYESNGGISPVNDEKKKIWNKMTEIESIYSNIGIFKQALVGKSVFHGDWIFSQDGCKYDNKIKYNSPAKNDYYMEEGLNLYDDEKIKEGINYIDNDWKQTNRQLLVYNDDNFKTYNSLIGEPYTYFDILEYKPVDFPIGSEILTAVCTGYYVPYNPSKELYNGIDLYINIKCDNVNNVLNKPKNGSEFLFAHIDSNLNIVEDNGIYTWNNYPVYAFYYDNVTNREGCVKARRFFTDTYTSTPSITTNNAHRDIIKINDNEEYYVYGIKDSNNNVKLKWCSYLLKTNKIPDNNYSNFNPSVKDIRHSNTFSPYWAVNLKSGSMWTGGGSNYMLADGSGSLAGGKISWDTEGNFFLPPSGTMSMSSNSVGDKLTFKMSVTNSTSLNPQKPIVLSLKFEGSDNNGESISTELINYSKVVGIYERFPYHWTQGIYVDDISKAIGTVSYSQINATFYIDNIPVQSVDITDFVSLSYECIISVAPKNYRDYIDIQILGYTLESLDNEDDEYDNPPYLGRWDSEKIRGYDKVIRSLASIDGAMLGGSPLSFNIYYNDINNTTYYKLNNDGWSISEETTSDINFSDLWIVFAVKNTSYSTIKINVLSSGDMLEPNAIVQIKKLTSPADDDKYNMDWIGTQYLTTRSGNHYCELDSGYIAHFAMNPHDTEGVHVKITISE